jgi:hypothetical protein
VARCPRLGLVTLSGFECDRCRHRWFPRGSSMPLVCPKCKSPYWNTPRSKRKGDVTTRKGKVMRDSSTIARKTKSAQKQQIFTIGYQEKTALEFIRALRANKIDVLVDIRAVPMSRRSEFRQKALAALLEDAGIQYHGMRDLGTPAAIRDALKETKDYKSFFRAFNKYLGTQQAALGELISLAHSKRCALMCFEKDATQCHRSAVASYVKSKVSCETVDL